MAVQRTFSIIKPDATKRNITGKVNAKIEEAGLRIVAQKRLQLTKEQAGGFYAVHSERPFYNDLVNFMMSGPVVVQVLEGENAIARYREVMGATNPADADAGTIRAEFAESIDANTTSGPIVYWLKRTTSSIIDSPMTEKAASNDSTFSAATKSCAAEAQSDNIAYAASVVDSLIVAYSWPNAGG